jgi:hypothetical protein
MFPDNNDCMYLHMMIPTKSNSTEFKKFSNNSNKDNKKRSYFEIGCKIFEINKIYR